MGRANNGTVVLADATFPRGGGSRVSGVDNGTVVLAEAMLPRGGGGRVGRVKGSVIAPYLLILVNALSIIAMAPYIVSLYESAVVISFSSSSSGASSEISSSSTIRASTFLSAFVCKATTGQS